MRILYIPLDERPCNYLYPQMISKIQDDIELIVPEKSFLGNKKQPADIEKLWEWIEQNVHGCEAMICSIEMLVYGGLLPSRIHNMTLDKCLERLNRLKKLKQENKQLEIFAFNLIMRTPSYSNSEEEPDYYADFGEEIFKYGWLTDKRDREGLGQDQNNELNEIIERLPEEIINDYAGRRKINIQVNKEVVELVKDETIEFLSIPQDDSAPYGFTAMDQKYIIKAIKGNRLQQKINVYPGADEVGCTLLSRVYQLKNNKTPNVYILYSATLGSSIIPLYEDRPLGESLKSHIQAAGGRIVENPEVADVILAVNCAGKTMQESWEQDNKDITYDSYRNLREFTAKIEYFIKKGKKCAIADVAFSNGGEVELIELLDEMRLLDEIIGYAGWNTNCNTIGTVLCTALIGLNSNNKYELTYNKIYRLLEDVGYQANVRQSTIKKILPKYDASYYNFNGKEEQINQEIGEGILDFSNNTILHSFKDWSISNINCFTPWHRMFEVGLDFELEKVNR